MKIPKWLLRRLKKKSRIYIFPTKMGGYLNGLIFLMFLLSLGYSNNLLLIFTLFLFGFNLIWVIQTHFHLHALNVENVIISDGHAKDTILVQVHLKKIPKGPKNWKMKLEGDESHELLPLDQTDSSYHGQVVFPKRGLKHFSYLRVKTEMPFGLYQAWNYFALPMKAYVYPVKLQGETLTSFLNSSLEGENSTLLKGPHDIWNLAPYQGEEARKINWKHYARSGELVVKEGEELTQAMVHFKFDGTEQNKEYILSKLTTQMILCARTETPFTLETPKLKTYPGKDEKHLSDCLRELTQC